MSYIYLIKYILYLKIFQIVYNNFIHQDIDLKHSINIKIG
jgi:hypothetical protein